MKILYINSLDKRYGSTYRSRNIVKALLGLGHDVIYVESNISDRVFENNVSIEQEDSLFGYLAAIRRRLLISLRLDYDILYLQKFIPLTVLCLIAGKIRGKKCVVDWDDLDWAFQKNIIRKIIVFLCEHFFPYFADVVTTHSQRLKRYGYRLGVKQVEIVNQVVDFDEVNISDEEKDKLRKQIGAHGKKILCFLGTLTTGGAGDLDIIIKVVSSLAKKRDDVFFLMVSGGPLGQRFCYMMKQFNLTDNSYTTGLITHSEVKRFLSISDAGLIYMRDNIGNRMRVSFKVLEYLKSGIPVLGYLVGETKDRFSKFCSLSQRGDDFTSNIINFLDNKNYIQNNHLDFNEYSLENIRVSLAKVINRL